MNKSGYSILIVDDEKDFLASMEFWFKSQGYAVQTATGGEEALEILKKGAPSVVFLDYMMPVMSGIELLMRIRNVYPRLPVVMLTAHGHEEMRVEAYKHGVNGVFDKSLDFYKAEHILNSLVRVVSRHRPDRPGRKPRRTGLAVLALAACLVIGLGLVLFSRPQVCFGPHCVAVEIARTVQERSRGLMDRRFLAANAGMLFIFPREDSWAFWMKDTYIPLDIIWIDKDGRVAEIVRNASPAPGVLDPPSLGGTYPSLYVLEVNAGFARKVGITTGSRARFSGFFSRKSYN